MLVSEILTLVEKAKTKEEKKQILLQHNNNHAMLFMFCLSYDPKISWYLPEGAPPFKREVDKPMGYHQTTIQNELRRFYIWGNPDTNIPKVKKEALFIEMLEGLHYTEADIVIACKDKKLHSLYKSVTEDLVREVFPNMLSPKLVEAEPAKKTSTKKSSTSVEAQ